MAAAADTDEISPAVLQRLRTGGVSDVGSLMRTTAAGVQPQREAGQPPPPPQQQQQQVAAPSGRSQPTSEAAARRALWSGGQEVAGITMGQDLQGINAAGEVMRCCWLSQSGGGSPATCRYRTWQQSMQ
jgi:hypothetical protein